MKKDDGVLDKKHNWREMEIFEKSPSYDFLVKHNGLNTHI